MNVKVGDYLLMINSSILSMTQAVTAGIVLGEIMSETHLSSAAATQLESQNINKGLPHSLINISSTSILTFPSFGFNIFFIILSNVE